MTDTDHRPTPPRMRPWLRVLLGVSLALNLLIVGLVAGAMMRFGGPDGMRPPPRSLGAALYRELPRDARKTIRAAMTSGPDGLALHRRDGVREIAEALRTEPFDPVALAAALDARARAQAAWLSSVQAAWLDEVKAMSATERAAYAERLEDALNRPHRRKRDRKDR